MWFFYCSLLHLRTANVCVIVTWALCVCAVVWAWLCINVCSCVSFTSRTVSYFLSWDSPVVGIPLSLSLCFSGKIGEEREEWRHDSSDPWAQPLRWVAQCEVSLHTNNFAPDLRAEKPQSRADGDSSPRHPRRHLATQPPQRQPLWQHGGRQQVSVSGQRACTCVWEKIQTDISCKLQNWDNSNFTKIILRPILFLKIEFRAALIVHVHKYTETNIFTHFYTACCKFHDLKLDTMESIVRD